MTGIGRRWLACILGISYFTMHPSLLLSLPQMEGTAAGSVSCHQPDQNTLIVEASDKSIINYKSFNIQATERVQFIQPSPSSTVLNRVVGKDLSSIFGRMDSNGKVLLVNPQGVVFGPHASVSVGSLIVSTLNIADQDFLNDNYTFVLESGSANSSIVNQGQISVCAEGALVLLAPEIKNTGIITARTGKVVLASAEKVTLDFVGDQLMSFALDGDLAESFIQQAGTIEALQGDIHIKAKVAGEVIRRTVNMDGFEPGEQMVEENGVISIVSGSRNCAQSITLEAPVVNLESTEVVATEDLLVKAEDRVRLRDAKGAPLKTIAYRDFFLESDAIDILAFYDDQTQMASGRHFTFASENEISADGHFFSGGDLSFIKPSGGNADFRSLFDPVISATGSVTFGAYSGVSLLVQSTGRITPTGAITITSKDTAITAGTQAVALNTESSLILNAGLAVLDASYVGNVFAVPPNQTQGGATFTNTGTFPGTDITFTGGTITLNAFPASPGGVVSMSAPGGITFGAATTISAASGTVTFANDVNGDIPGRTLSINAGSINFQTNVGEAQPLSTLSLTTVTGNIQLNSVSGNTVLGGATTLSAANGSITFNGTVDADVPGRTFNATSLNAVTFQKDVGKTVPLSTMTIATGSGNIQLNALSGNTMAGGAINFSSESGNILIGAAGVNSASINCNQVAQTMTMQTSGSGAIIFAGPIGNIAPFSTTALTTGAGNIQLNASSGNTTAGGAISFISSSGNILIGAAGVNSASINCNQVAQTMTMQTSGSGAIIFAGPIGNIAPFSTTALTTGAGNIQLNASSGNTTAGGAISFSSSSGNILIGTVGGNAASINSNLTAVAMTMVTSGSGNIVFAGPVGNVTPFGTTSITTASGNISLNASSGNTIFGGTTSLLSRSGNISLGTVGTNAASVNSSEVQEPLTVETSGGGTITFAGPLGTLSLFSSLFFSTGTGAIAFDGAMLLGGPTVLNTEGGSVSFASTLDGSTITTSNSTYQLMNLTINVPSGTNGITFSGPVGQTGPLNVVTLATDGGPVTFSDFFCFSSPAITSTITTSTGEALGGAVSFGVPGVKMGGALSIVTEGGAVTFNGPVNGDVGGRALSVNSGAGNIRICLQPWKFTAPRQSESDDDLWDDGF